WVGAALSSIGSPRSGMGAGRRLAPSPKNRHDMAVNEESLKRVNAFLAAICVRVQVGEVVTVTPADIGREVGLPEPLAAARAVRALLARRRLEVADGGYRLIDARPVDPGERESIARQPRKRRKVRAG